MMIKYIVFNSLGEFIGAYIVGSVDEIPHEHKSCFRQVDDEVFSNWWQYKIQSNNIVSVERSIDDVRLEKIEQVNSWRKSANSGAFTWRGKQFYADEETVKSLFSVAIVVSLSGQLPVDWPGFWKADDNEHVPILTVSDMQEFCQAMQKKGQDNFFQSEMLKQQIMSAATVVELEKIII